MAACWQEALLWRGHPRPRLYPHPTSAQAARASEGTASCRLPVTALGSPLQLGSLHADTAVPRARRERLSKFYLKRSYLWNQTKGWRAPWRLGLVTLYNGWLPPCACPPFSLRCVPIIVNPHQPGQLVGAGFSQHQRSRGGKAGCARSTQASENGRLETHSQPPGPPQGVTYDWIPILERTADPPER